MYRIRVLQSVYEEEVEFAEARMAVVPEIVEEELQDHPRQFGQ